jgi:hypothetical protein
VFQSHNRVIVALDSPAYSSFNFKSGPEHHAMSSPQPKSQAKTLTRRFFRIASLGLAGLLAGLLAGCTASAATYETASYGHSTNLPITQPKSLESSRTPETKRSPAPHHVQPWPSYYGQNPPVVASDIQSGHTMAAYTFTAAAPSHPLNGQ